MEVNRGSLVLDRLLNDAGHLLDTFEQPTVVIYHMNNAFAARPVKESKAAADEKPPSRRGRTREQLVRGRVASETASAETSRGGCSGCHGRRITR